MVVILFFKYIGVLAHAASADALLELSLGSFRRVQQWPERWLSHEGFVPLNSHDSVDTYQETELSSLT